MRKLVLQEWLSLDGYAVRLERVSVRTYDTGVVFVHYEPRREGRARAEPAGSLHPP